MRTPFLLLAWLLFGAGALASEEEHAVWSSVEISTSNIPHAGPVGVSARTSAGRISNLVIVAFGRTNAVPQEALKKIRQFPLADMKITHEAGYPQLGGYSVNVRLRRSAYDSAKNLRDETAVITVTEKNGLQPVAIR